MTQSRRESQAEKPLLPQWRQ